LFAGWCYYTSISLEPKKEKVVVKNHEAPKPLMTEKLI
jgi:hypothetical protein